MEWSESIVVDRPAAEVLRAVADESELLLWSAWPQATGYACAIEGDGRTVGSAIVFTDKKGVVQGRQVLHDVDDHTVDYRLRNRGPGGREMTPHVRFRFDELDGARTRVILDFQAAAPLPPGLRHLVEAIMGRRVRRLHVKDLQQLKQHVESRSVR
ncbi:MAG: SRPBCC family protein [Mycobacterium sp.]